MAESQKSQPGAHKPDLLDAYRCPVGNDFLFNNLRNFAFVVELHLAAIDGNLQILPAIAL
jgi:hypothetical protein